MIDEGKRITFRVDEEFFERLSECCELSKMSVSCLIRDALEAYMDGAQSGLNDIGMYTRQISEMETQIKIAGLEAEVKYQSMRAERAELRLENEKLKSENFWLRHELNSSQNFSKLSQNNSELQQTRN